MIGCYCDLWDVVGVWHGVDRIINVAIYILMLFPRRFFNDSILINEHAMQFHLKNSHIPYHVFMKKLLVPFDNITADEVGCIWEEV